MKFSPFIVFDRDNMTLATQRRSECAVEVDAYQSSQNVRGD